MLPGNLADVLGAPTRRPGVTPKRRPVTTTPTVARPPVTVRPPSNPYVSASPTVGSQAPPTRSLASALSFQAPPEYTAPTFSTNYDADPVLQRIRALGTKNVADAQAEAQRVKQQAVIDTGLGNVGQSLGFDQNTIQAANNNPFSQTALLNKQYQDAITQNTESRNQQNLFYSGQRALDLTNLGNDKARAQTDLNSQLQGVLTQADQGVTAAQQNAQQQEADQLAAQAQAQAQQDYQNQIAAQQAAFQNQLAQSQADYQNNLMMALASQQAPDPGYDTSTYDPSTVIDSSGVYTPPASYDPVAQPALAYSPASDPFLQAMAATPNQPVYVRDPVTKQLILLG